MALVWGPTGITGESGEIWGMVEAPTPAPAPAAPTFSPLVAAFLQLLTPGRSASDQVWSSDTQSLVDGPSVWHAATYTATSGAAKGSTLTDDLGGYVTTNDGTGALEGGTSGIVATDQAGYDAYQGTLAAKAGLDPSAHYLLGSQSLANGINESDIYRVDSSGLTLVKANQWKPESGWVSFWRPALEASAAVVGASFGLAAAAGSLGGAATAAVDAAPATVPSVASDPLGAYLATGASDGSTIGGLGGYAGAVGANAAPEVLSVAVPGAATLTGSVDASLASSASSALTPTSSAAAPSLSSALPSLSTLQGGAGLASSLAGLAKTIGILPTTRPAGSPVPSSSSSSTSPSSITAAAQRHGLLLVGALVVGAFLLRKKGSL